MVHAGDAYVRGGSKHIQKLIKEYEINEADVIFYLKNVKNPKSYGVASTSKKHQNIYQVNNVEEKPKNPKSNNAIMPIYIFNTKIFNSLSKTKPGIGKELQLTDAIQKCIKEKNKVCAIKFLKLDDCIDIGTPENYFHAISISYNDSKKDVGN